MEKTAVQADSSMSAELAVYVIVPAPELKTVLSALNSPTIFIQQPTSSTSLTVAVIKRT
jgi:hypothetical protein